MLNCTSSILGCVFPANYVGSTGYKLARLCIVFGISGIGHLGGDVMATGQLGFKTFTFFMLQPFGITIETVICYLWRQFQGARSEPQKTTQLKSNQNGKPLVEEPIPPLWIRCVGSIWVAVWMLWTAAFMADALLSARLLSVKRGEQFSS
jgi:hypothetical protein